MLAIFRGIPEVASALAGFDDDEVMKVIEARRSGQEGSATA